MGVVVKLPGGKWRFYVKGASEVLTKKCVKHVVVESLGHFVNKTEVETSPIDERKRESIFDTITFYANQTLRTIAVCYRDLDNWPPAGVYGVDEVSA